MKALVRGKLIALSASKKKLERAYTTSLTSNLKVLEQKEANRHKRSRQQEITKIRVEINQLETKSTIQRINKTRSWFFEKINKTHKSLARLTRWHRDSIQNNKISGKRGPLVVQTLYASVQGNARAKKWESVGRGVGGGACGGLLG